jgi:hypothetical protein
MWPCGGLLAASNTAMSWKNLFPRPWPRPRTDGAHQPTDWHSYVQIGGRRGCSQFQSSGPTLLQRTWGLSCLLLQASRITSPRPVTLALWTCIACPSLSVSASLCVQGVSKIALQLWKLLQIYLEDMHSVLNCHNVARHTEFYLR